MSLINSLEIENFKCFRSKTQINLSQGTYLIGINNAGKTAILNALNFFFNDSLYQDETFLNRTTYLAKKAGYNHAEISITFNLEELTSNVLRNRLIRLFKNKKADIKKIITFLPSSRKVSFSYTFLGYVYDSFDDIDPDVKKLLMSVRVTYIHPQEGRDLLKNAQEKLRQRLLANWGRNPNLSIGINELQKKWEEFRRQARSYLSSSLTKSLQTMWPGSEAALDLPKNIKEIVEISDISFKGQQTLPEIELTSHGTGAQSTILYQTHYLLDSDRSLHRGEYHPIWLLEEPESFLHGDLMVKFSQELNSQAWLKNIQMVVSTHSPIILASSNLGGDNIEWCLLKEHVVVKNKKMKLWTKEEVVEIGKLMGDSNFYVYFYTSQDKLLTFIEDKRAETKDVYEQVGIKITNCFEGVAQITRTIDVLLNIPDLVQKKAYFIVDSDKGKDVYSKYIVGDPQLSNGFKKYLIPNSKSNLYIITLPDGFAVEDLFGEYETHLDSCINLIWDVKSWKLRTTIPTNLSRVASRARGNIITSLSEARKLIRNEQDIKDSFWSLAKKYSYSFEDQYVMNLKNLLT